MNPPHFPKISAVVPVYKVENYLQECIDSILAQTFTNFELILVNDGSPDNSGAICDANAARDSRIRVIHQENLGVNRARANGVAAAGGEFICFVDADDTLTPDALSTLAIHADEATDIVLGKIIGQRHPEAGEISHDKYREICVCLRTILGSPCARLYRRSLFDDDIFNIPPEVRIGEDAIMNIRLAYKLQGRVFNTDAAIYNYRTNEESTMHTCMTPEIIAVFQKHRLASVPQDDIRRFLPCGLADHLIHFWIMATRNRARIPSSAMEAHHYLLSVRKYSSIHFNLYSGFLFYCVNPWLRFIGIHLHDIFHLFKRYCWHKKSDNH